MIGIQIDRQIVAFIVALGQVLSRDVLGHNRIYTEYIDTVVLTIYNIKTRERKRQSRNRNEKKTNCRDLKIIKNTNNTNNTKVLEEKSQDKTKIKLNAYTCNIPNKNNKNTVT